MKTIFSGHYRPSPEDFQKLWDECLFVFDTNVLLNLYRYQEESRKILFKIFDKIQDRIWIPYQVGVEYHASVQKIMDEQNSGYDKLYSSVHQKIKDIQKYLSECRYPNIQVTNITERFDELDKSIQEYIEQQRLNHPNLDYLKENISKIIGSNIGREYTQVELDEIYIEGEKRYQLNIPPGYEDAKEKQKLPPQYHNGIQYKQEYGDLVYWLQVIEKAKDSEVRSVVLVTDDRKKDWWNTSGGKVHGPLPDLIHEFKRETKNKDIYIYQLNQFIKFASENHLVDSDEVEIKNTITDIEEIHNLELPTLPEGLWDETEIGRIQKQAYFKLAKLYNHKMEIGDIEKAMKIYEVLRNVQNKIQKENFFYLESDQKDFVKSGIEQYNYKLFIKKENKLEELDVVEFICDFMSENSIEIKKLEVINNANGYWNFLISTNKEMSNRLIDGMIFEIKNNLDWGFISFNKTIMTNV
ncbi:hypothetical protein C4A75_18515 [Brevibacillus laterosporus]|uniref:PIN-like domain-containing protein n=1 Tax=Brevibacillus laterosporus TaxID=1465 RepID=UPI000CE524FB|nr:PIN-like domain-containing protein [Brevibacillus laterosporus]PPA82510.1 hypothetical protein C4A75_18515 [Brevibacillus laterosporus]